jgi:hypothetical protein
MNSLHFNIEYHCNKNEAKWSSSWSGTPFWPISLRKVSKRGAKQGGIPSITKSCFQRSKRFLIIKEVLLSCFEVKRDWGGPFGPKLCEPSTWVILLWCASKKSHFQTFTQLTPSAKLPRMQPWHTSAASHTQTCTETHTHSVILCTGASANNRVWLYVDPASLPSRSLTDSSFKFSF